MVLAAACCFGIGLSAAYFLTSPLNGPAVCPMPEAELGDFVAVQGGRFTHGKDALYPEEGPPRQVFVSPFAIQIHEVTNDQFAAFVAATGYVTEAEQSGASARFDKSGSLDAWLSWWKLDQGATWRTPEGNGSDLQGKGRHPVVHVTLNDARAYADWAGGRLPTELEWEYAASLGLFNPDDPESGRRDPAGQARANTWTGVFPAINTEADGFVGAAPVGCYEKSRIGAYDMIGNVWEWTDSRFDPQLAEATIKGGSYLCGSNFCQRYRPAARQALEPDFSTAHVGFRIVKTSLTDQKMRMTK